MGRVAPRKIDTPFLKHEEFQQFVQDERLVKVLRAILGKDPLLVEDQILMKPRSSAPQALSPRQRLLFVPAGG